MRIFQFVLVFGYLIYEYAIKQLYPMPLDVLLVVVYTSTWVFKTNEKRFKVTSSLVFGVLFMLLLGKGFSPTEEQLQELATYESNNEMYSQMLETRYFGQIPNNYIDASRLIIECQIRGFKKLPPKPIELNVDL